MTGFVETIVVPLLLNEAENVIGYMAREADKHASLIYGFKKDFSLLKSNMKKLQCRLKFSAEEDGQNLAERDRSELDAAIDAVYKAEDILEKCVLRYGRTARGISRFATEGCFRYRVGKEIRQLNSAISNHLSSLIGDGTVNPTLSRNPTGRRNSAVDGPPIGDLDQRAREVAGSLDATQKIVSLDATQKIVVEGEAGVGKTLLLREVFEKLRRNYEISIWIDVTRKRKTQTMIYDICDQVSLPLSNEGISCELKARKILNHLQGKRCLIVLDDVWNDADLLCGELGLPAGQKTCNILISTRNKTVANELGVRPYHMKGLSPEDSKTLFYSHAFGSGSDRGGMEEVKTVAEEIIASCKGNPLALIQSGKALYNSPPEKWDLTLNIVLREFRQSREEDRQVNRPLEERLIKVIDISYRHLPSHLKVLFAYLAVLPENGHFDRERIAHLWMSEGFLKTDQDPYSMASIYLDDLFCPGLINKDCKANTFRANPLLYKLACRKFKAGRDIGIDVNAEKLEQREMAERENYRRVSFADKNVKTIAEDLKCSNLLHSLFLNDNPELGTIPEGLFKEAKRLRVLDLHKTRIKDLPRCVRSLKFLRHLDLGSTGIEAVPECVRFLKCLRFLSVADCSLKELPYWIGDMHTLEVLCLSLPAPSATSNSTRPTTEIGIETLPKLRYFKVMGCRGWQEIPFALGTKGNFPKLEFLCITDFPELTKAPMIEEGGLPSLKHLYLHNCPQMNTLPEGLGTCPRNNLELRVQDVGDQLMKRLTETNEEHKKLRDCRVRIYVNNVFSADT